MSATRSHDHPPLRLRSTSRDARDRLLVERAQRARSAAARRDAVLRPLSAAVREAVTAAYNALPR